MHHRYLIILEDRSVCGTGDEEVAELYASDVDNVVIDTETDEVILEDGTRQDIDDE